MQDTNKVHAKTRDQRIARGIRMSESLWEFVDGQAGAIGEPSASRLIERWVREKLEAVRQVA